MDKHQTTWHDHPATPCALAAAALAGLVAGGLCLDRASHAVGGNVLLVIAGFALMFGGGIALSILRPRR